MKKLVVFAFIGSVGFASNAWSGQVELRDAEIGLYGDVDSLQYRVVSKSGNPLSRILVKVGSKPGRPIPPVVEVGARPTRPIPPK